MSVLKQVETGRKIKPMFICIYGTGGIGKSTFAASAPKPLFLETESGSDNLDVSRVKVTSFHMLKIALKELLDTEHEYKTVVIDSLDQLEPMIHTVVAAYKGKENIEDIGYAKGYIYALEYWESIIKQLVSLREEKRMNVILVAHSQIRKFDDPAQESPYDEYELKLHKKASAYITENVDALLFATYKMFFRDADSGKKKPVGQGERVMFTEQRPGYVAKNRFRLPHKMPLIWGKLTDEIKKGRQNGSK